MHTDAFVAINAEISAKSAKTEWQYTAMDGLPALYTLEFMLQDSNNNW